MKAWKAGVATVAGQITDLAGTVGNVGTIAVTATAPLGEHSRSAANAVSKALGRGTFRSKAGDK